MFRLLIFWACFVYITRHKGICKLSANNSYCDQSFHTIKILLCLLQDISHIDYRHRRQEEFDEDWAVEGCQELMNTTIVNMCSEIDGFDTAVFFNNCVADALVKLL